MKFKRQRSQEVGVDLTPLIDVVFILLVFFMLTTRLLPVNLLEVSTEVQSESGGQKGERVPEIRILAGQQLEWNQQVYGLDDLVRQLTGSAIGRVNVISSPEATVHDFTLALSTLGASGIEPNWLRANDENAD